jgi:preprotein translocase subunit SecE
VTTLSFLGSAILAYVVVNVLFKALAGAFGIMQRWYSIGALNHGLPIVAAVAVFAALQFNPKALAWAEDVITEVSKVVWPSRKDTLAMSIVVCVFVGIACLLLMVIDFIAQNFIKMIVY